MIPTDTSKQVELLAQLATDHQRILSTAESCTGGLIAAALTEVSGSSAWFDRGFVTYSNAAKLQMLGVEEAILERNGAVSGETVVAMAQGALRKSNANLAVSVSGVAGPTGGTQEKPVGTVWIAIAGAGIESIARPYLFSGDRASIRMQTVDEALQLLIRCIKSESL